MDLPPPFRLLTLREVGDAFAHACAVASQEGAGTLVHVGRFDLAELAVVLEPDEPLALARRSFYAGMVALGDALVARAPPERPIAFVWPDAIHVDGGLVGGARLAWPSSADEAEVPDWLVFSAMVRVVAMGEGEAGLHPLSTALEDEGFADLDTGWLAEGFARHLMATLDIWQSDGFEAVAQSYLQRLKPQKGATYNIDANADLLVNWRGGHSERHSLAQALGQASWLDPESGGPRR
ncbi:MAG TPA: biotin/lipoate--protein ligase family protein [Hyphomicrobiaceae bacterium]|jgi:hypothetical protein|nr:biotin/lipoate--protein ligase family protein [Hyphomicrobiaceae bacterium]